MGKGKLAKFADMETYENVFQYPYSVVEHVPFEVQGHWHEKYFKNNTYVTPESTSILPSITNKSLMQVAEDLGMKVERRPIPEEELETFEEAGACGTAAVISPISYIDDLDTGKRYSFGDKPGPQSKKLFDTLRGIQYGEIEDKHGWTTVVIE